MGGMSSSVQVNLLNLLILIMMLIMILGGLMTISHNKHSNETVTAKEKMILLKVEEMELHGKCPKR